MLIQAPLCSYQQDLACISSRCIFTLAWAELSMSPSCHPISAWKYPSMSRDNELERWGPTPAKAILPHHGSTDRSTCSCIVEQVPRWVQWALAESGEVWYGCVSRFPPHLVVFPHTWDYTDDASVDTSIVNNNKKTIRNCVKELLPSKRITMSLHQDEAKMMTPTRKRAEMEPFHVQVWWSELPAG